MLEMRCQKCQANFHFTHFIQKSACARFFGINCFFKFLPRVVVWKPPTTKKNEFQKAYLE